MKFPAPLILPFLLSFLIATPAYTADSASIGYVDMQVVLDKSKVGQAAQKELEAQFAGRQEELNKEEKSIRQLQQTLARDEPLMSKDESAKRKGEIGQRIRAFQEKLAKAQQELAQEKNKVGNRILEPAQAIIAEVSKERRLTAVFERRASGLLYVDKGVDVTSEVIERLDAQEKK